MADASTPTTAEVQKVLQQIAILATGNATNAAGLELLESLAFADSDFTTLVNAVNGFMGAQATAQGSAKVIQGIAHDALGLQMTLSEAGAMGALIDSGQYSWADLFVYCINASDFSGQTLHNRADTAQSFLSGLQDAQKSAYFDGAAVFAAVKTLLQGVGASDTSAATAKGALAALAANLKSTGMQGAVVDGYVKGATVFIDANGDGVLSAGEWSTTSDANGNYLVPLNTAPGKLIAIGGTDIMTGKAFQGVLTAPLGSTVVTPLTTLAQALMESGQASSAQAAASMVQQALGLSSSLDLLNYDPLAVLADANASAAAKAVALGVQAAAVQVANVIAQMGAAIDAGSSATQLSAGNAVIVALAGALGTGQSVDLTDPAVLAGVAQTAATAAGAPSVGAAAQDLAQITAASNTAAGSAQNITQLAQSAVVAQSSAITAITDGVTAGSLDSAVSGFTGSALNTLIGQAQPGELVPGVDVPAPPPPANPGGGTPPADTTAPQMASAAVSADGLSVVITYSETLTGTAEAGDYAITVGGGYAGSISGAAIGSGADANKVTLTMSHAIAQGAAVSNIVYTASAGAAGSIKDAAATPNVAGDQTLPTITNGSALDLTAPAMISAAVSVDGNSIVVTYSEPVGGTLEGDDWGVTLSAGTATVTGATIGVGADANKITLALSNTILNTVTVTDLSYTATSGTADSVTDQATTPNSAATQTLGTVTNGSTAALEITYSADTFTEAVANDGSSTTSITLTLTGDTYAADLTGKIVATNVPAGMTASFVRTSDTVVTATLTGNATAHANANDVANLSFTFQDGAFAGTAAAADVTGYAKSNLKVDFVDPSFEVTDTGGVITFGGTKTGDITFTTSGSNTTFYRGGLAASTTVDLSSITKITVASGQEISESAAKLAGLTIDGAGEVRANYLESAMNADLGGITATTFKTYAHFTAGSTGQQQPFGGNLGNATLVVTGTEGRGIDLAAYTPTIGANAAFMVDQNAFILALASDLSGKSVSGQGGVGVRIDATSASTLDMSTMTNTGSKQVIVMDTADISGNTHLSNATNFLLTDEAFTLTATAAQVNGKALDGVGTANITSLGATPAANLSSINVTTVTVAVSADSSFSGSFGTAVVTVDAGKTLTLQTGTMVGTASFAVNGTLDLHHSLAVGSLTNTVTGSGTVHVKGSAGFDSINLSGLNVSGFTGQISLRGGDANDILTGTAAVDVFKFEATAADNGVDTILGFTAGTGGDVLDFSTFLGAPATALTGVVADDATANQGVATGNILCVTDAGNDLDADAIALLFGGGGRPFGAIAASDKYVLITDAGKIWFVDTALDGTASNMTAGDVTLVGTISGGLVLGNLVGANFGI